MWCDGIKNELFSYECTWMEKRNHHETDKQHATYAGYNNRVCNTMRSKEWWEEKNVFKKESVGMKDRQEEKMSD